MWRTRSIVESMLLFVHNHQTTILGDGHGDLLLCLDGADAAVEFGIIAIHLQFRILVEHAEVNVLLHRFGQPESGAFRAGTDV